MPTASVRTNLLRSDDTDAPSGLPRVLSWLGRLSCRNTGSQLNGRHPRPVNAYLILLVQLQYERVTVDGAFTPICATTMVICEYGPMDGAVLVDWDRCQMASFVRFGALQ
jgi:hypothetical protein